MNQKTENRYHKTRNPSRRGDAGECGGNVNWRAVLELEASDGPPLPMKTTAQLLAAMMRRGMLDALDEPPILRAGASSSRTPGNQTNAGGR